MRITSMINHHFPLKTVTDCDQPWITNQLKHFKCTCMREYCHHGKSNKYIELKSKFAVKQAESVKHYTSKIIDEVIEGKRSSSYKALRKLGVRKGDMKDDL